MASFAWRTEREGDDVQVKLKWIKIQYCTGKTDPAVIVTELTRGLVEFLMLEWSCTYSNS
jgi:hypothetical protein